MKDIDKLAIDLVMMGVVHLKKWQWDLLKKVIDEDYEKESNSLTLKNSEKIVKKVTSKI